LSKVAFVRRRRFAALVGASVLAVPMLALYVLGIIVAFIFGKKRRPSTD